MTERVFEKLQELTAQKEAQRIEPRHVLFGALLEAIPGATREQLQNAIRALYQDGRVKKYGKTLNDVYIRIYDEPGGKKANRHANGAGGHIARAERREIRGKD